MKLAAILRLFFFSLLVTVPSGSGPAKEYLTPAEIAKIQDAQEIDERIKIYLEAASLRLKTAEDRLNGQESEPGDPFEFSTVEDMLDAYYQILNSVMMNLDAAYQNPKTERARVQKALKNLKGNTEKSEKDLQILKKMAEENQKEQLWNLTNKALDITRGAREGAEEALSKQPAPAKKK